MMLLVGRAAAVAASFWEAYGPARPVTVVVEPEAAEGPSAEEAEAVDETPIADEADVGHLEDRRFLVLVDRDDDLGILHPGEVLDGARNADCHIEFGRDDLARRVDDAGAGRFCDDRLDAGGGDHDLVELVGGLRQHGG